MYSVFELREKNFLRIKAHGYFEMPMIKHDNKKASQNGKLCNAALRSRYQGSVTILINKKFILFCKILS